MTRTTNRLVEVGKVTGRGVGTLGEGEGQELFYSSVPQEFIDGVGGWCMVGAEQGEMLGHLPPEQGPLPLGIG